MQAENSADLDALVSATAKTQSVIEGLQARLRGEPAPKVRKQASTSVSRKKDVADLVGEETQEELEKQLQAYFATAEVRPLTLTSTAEMSRVETRNDLRHDDLRQQDDLRLRVVEGVVVRILGEWARNDQERPPAARLGNEIMDRLIQRVMEQFRGLAVAS
jgi:hypothetical protein